MPRLRPASISDADMPPNRPLNAFLRLLAAFAVAGGVRADAPAGGDHFLTTVLPLVKRDCAGCHGERKSRGGVNFSGFTNAASVFRDPGLWEKTIRQLEDRAMPPEDKPQPNPDERYALVESIRQVLDNPEPGWIAKDPGAPVIHRLNRTEFDNTLRDLLGATNSYSASFPSDGGGGGGFDNNAATLFVPPIFMERLIRATGEALAAAPADRLLAEAKPWWRSERGHATANLSAFLARAWRRPPDDDETERLVAVYDRARKRGAAFEPAFRDACRAALVSPNFLYRIEHEETNGAPWRINDYELASRLSYFVWSSMPDGRLFQLASRRELHKPDVLRREVARMLADPKSSALAEGFAGQWLGARKLVTTVNPDRGKFPRFNDALRDAMMAEPVVFFGSLVRDGASLLNLIDARFTFANRDLAALYGVSNAIPPGPALVRVALPDRRRGGILGMAAVLAQTSYPARTSPVLRGKWILEDLLGTPPPPPPPLVATLPPNDEVRDGLTFRQQLEKHRANPNCSGCHSKMDPLGFALENYDPIGGWRDTVGDKPVDALGVLLNGDKVNGPAELKDALLARKALFLRHITGKMLAYALGRGVENQDYPTLREILDDLAANDNRADRLIADVVMSYPFQWRRAEEPKPSTAAVTASNR
jgi:Protein of unknown function (DUF1592)/Protein of unknown function (DUF1588)/Protein of unknown function (DUF1585)/Protein of unknown function (DUF1595)/Protein of unknown function (DUF1587)/Cytochrome C oxidase, cbb3-type, subunit III